MQIETIAKNLGRTTDAVLLMAYNKLGLRQQVSANGLYLTTTEVSKILSVALKTPYFWIEQGYLKRRTFKTNSKKRYRICHEDFIDFLHKHQDKWNSQKSDLSFIKSCCSSYYLSADGGISVSSFDWLDVKIERDRDGFNGLKSWTTKEEYQVMKLREQGVTYKYIAEKLDRTYSSIQSRVFRKIKQNSLTEML